MTKTQFNYERAYRAVRAIQSGRRIKSAFMILRWVQLHQPQAYYAALASIDNR